MPDLNTPDPETRYLIEEALSGPLEAGSSVRGRIERLVGGILVGSAGLGLFVWLMFLLQTVLGGGAVAVHFGDRPVAGVLGMLLLTPVILGLAGTQALLGVGLLRQRTWVGWFGLLYVLGTVLGTGLMGVLPAGLLASAAAALLGTLPTWVFVARRARGTLDEGEDG